jgi:hypothetical protein
MVDSNSIQKIYFHLSFLKMLGSDLKRESGRDDDFEDQKS